jgi:hypothetical protein
MVILRKTLRDDVHEIRYLIIECCIVDADLRVETIAIIRDLIGYYELYQRVL